MSNRRIGWMFSLTALLATGWLSPARASGKPIAVYTGTLGKQAVVFDLGGGTDLRPGNYYFYTRHHRDLGLDGNTGTDHLVLREGWHGGDARPIITLDRQADGGWRGSWQSQAGETLPIVLHPANPMPPAADALPYLKQLYASNTYEYLRLASLKLKTGKRERFMGHTLQWWRAPDANITFFEILDGYPNAERRRINRVLMDRLLRETSAFYACIDIPDNGGDYKQTVTPHLLTPNLVSVTVFTSYYCGGAHPSTSRDPINLDAHTGHKLWLDDILWLGKGQPFHYDPIPGEPDDSQANMDRLGHWTDHQKQVLEPWLTAQLKKRYPKQMAGSKVQCSYTDYPDAWAFADWYLTPKGVFFIPTFPHAADMCTDIDDWSLLPYSEIRNHPGKLRLTLP